MKTLLRVILCLALCGIAGTATGQNGCYTLDLATLLSASEKKVDKNTGAILVTEKWSGDSLFVDSVRLLNTLYGYDYSVSVGKSKVNRVLPVFQMPGDGLKLLDTPKDSLRNVRFDDLRYSLQVLFTVDSEKVIPAAYSNLRAVVNEITIQRMIPQSRADSVLLDSAQKIVARGAQLDFRAKIRLGKNDVLTIRIARAGFVIVYTIRMPEEVQRWFVHYGFTYTPQFISPSRQYYSKSDTGSTYLITRMNGRNGNFLDNLSPTLQFSYRLLSNRWMLSPSLVGGFSLNFTNPSAMFGAGCLIGDNLSLNIGMMFSQRLFLKGEYTDNQRIDSNKTFDDLHNKQYVPELCFSIAFRFDENPFKTKEEGK